MACGLLNYNLWMVIHEEVFAEKPLDAQAPWAVFECLTEAAAAAISLHQHAACHCCGWACVWGSRSISDNSGSVSDDKACVYGLLDTRCATAKLLVDWRLVAGQLCQLSTVCVSDGMPAQVHIACCRICIYTSFLLSHCQPQCCCCR